MSTPAVDPQAEQERQERLRIVALGISAENFVGSPLGRYIVLRAEKEREAALEELVAADPHATTVVQNLQNRVRVIDMVQQWIADAIVEGQAQERALVNESIEAGQG